MSSISRIKRKNQLISEVPGAKLSNFSIKTGIRPLDSLETSPIALKRPEVKLPSINHKMSPRNENSMGYRLSPIRNQAISVSSNPSPIRKSKDSIALESSFKNVQHSKRASPTRLSESPLPGKYNKFQYKGQPVNSLSIV